MIDQKKLTKLREARRKGIGRLLLLARKDFVDRLSPKLQELSGSGSLTTSVLLPFIDLEGTRSVDIARRAGISKQAIAKAVQQMQEAGLVTRTPDAADGRAFLVTFTDRGIDHLVEIHEVIDSVERDYKKIIGTEQMEALRRSLSRIVYPDERGEE